MSQKTQEEDDEEQEDDAFALHQAQTWSPEPVNADIRNTPKAQRMHDIISMLVHIYGSKDLFINEYRCLFPSKPSDHSAEDLHGTSRK